MELPEAPPPSAILTEVQPNHGQAGVDQLAGELGLEQAFDLARGRDFPSVSW